MYNTSAKNANLKYLKNNQKRVSLNWLKDDFEQRVEPAIKKSGLPVSTFIKQAVEEKLIKDGLLK